jgi:ribosomal protein S18 acetylase RimI-like enzyme
MEIQAEKTIRANPMRIDIRKASLEDAQVLALLGRVTFDDAFAHLFADQAALRRYYDDAFSVPGTRRDLLAEDTVFWLALVEELPAAYAKLRKDKTHECLNGQNAAYLQRIYVMKHFSHLGIGNQLMEQVVEEARLRNDRLWLEVWNGNHRAKNFYFRWGFEGVGRVPVAFAQHQFIFDILAKPLD